MKRAVLIVIGFALLLILGWGLTTCTWPSVEDVRAGSDDIEGFVPAKNTAKAALASNTVKLGDKIYQLKVLEPCGYGEGGQFSLVAVTLETSGAISTRGPQFSLRSGPWESVADFVSENGKLHRISKRGSTRFDIDDGRLWFSGRTDAPSEHAITIDLACPRLD